MLTTLCLNAALVAYIQEFNLSNSSFTDKLIAQYTIYLLQTLGINLGYVHVWDGYKMANKESFGSGPLCASLRLDLHEILAAMTLDKDVNFKLVPAAFNRAQELHKLIASKPDNLNVQKWLELTASIHFLRHGPSPEKPGNTLKATIISQLTNPDFSTPSTIENIEVAWACLDSLGLIDKEALDSPAKSAKSTPKRSQI